VKAKRGYSQHKRPDRPQSVIALVITPDRFPLAYEVMIGNTSGRKPLPGLLKKVESTYGKARRVWMIEHGVPSEAILKGTARAGATEFLSGRHTEKQNQRARKEVAGSAMAKGARFGEGEAVPA
jgi:hypothetical protein